MSRHQVKSSTIEHASVHSSHHVLLVYSPQIATYITEDCGFELSAKSDFRFIENVYKLLLSNFGGYKP